MSSSDESTEGSKQREPLITASTDSLPVNSENNEKKDPSRHRISLPSGKPSAADGGSMLKNPSLIMGNEAKNNLAGDRFQQAYLLLQRRKYKQQMYRDLCLFTLFYSLFVAVIFMQRSVTDVFYTEDALRDIFVREEFIKADAPNMYKAFPDIGEVSEFWQWTLGPFLNAVSQTNEQEQGSILRYNRILGSARMRQLRVRADSCEITSAFQPFYTSTGCYNFYTTATANTDTYGPSLNETLNRIIFDPVTGEEKTRMTFADTRNPCAPLDALPGFCHNETDAPPIYGRVTDWYDGGGFFIDISYNGDLARQQITTLYEAEWIDLHTSAVIFTVNTLNIHMNLFTNMVFVVEFTPGGGFVNSYNFRTFKSQLYATPLDMFRLGMEIVWTVMLLLWVLYDVYQMIDVRRKHGSLLMWLIRPWWNFVDVVNKAIFVVTTVWYIIFWLNLNSFIDSIGDLNQDSSFIVMEDLAYQWTFMFNIVAVNLIISTFTVFKYLNVNPRMSMMWKTLEKASPDLAAFLLFFGIIFMTFVAAGYLMFGTAMDNFRTFTKSVFACFNMLLGDFRYDELEQSNKYFAPVFFMMFMLLVTFILVNMFLAIVQDAYVIVQLKYKNRPTLAVAMRRWIEKQSDKARQCVGKTSLGSSYEAAAANITNKQVRRMLLKLGVQPGDELSREEIIDALPNAPDSHVDYIFNLLADPDAMLKVRQAIDEEDDEDEEEDEENAQKGALMHERRAQSAGVLGVAAAAMGGELKRHDEPTHADLLRMLLEVESQLDLVEKQLVEEQVRRAGIGGLATPQGSRGKIARRGTDRLLNLFGTSTHHATGEHGGGAGGPPERLHDDNDQI